jgi:rhodanese-related sulfurtransferase
MELRHLRYFLAVGEASNFTKAAAQLRVAQPALSRQVKDLEDEIGVDLLRRSPRGVTLTAEGKLFLEEVRELLKRTYFEHPEMLSPLTMEEVMEEVRNNRVILLDLRNEDEFLFGHLPQARHIPFKDLAVRVSELPANCPILAYCRGPYCVTALNGTSLLRDLGIAADRLRFGTPEWKAAGLPLEFDHKGLA